MNFPCYIQQGRKGLTLIISAMIFNKILSERAERPEITHFSSETSQIVFSFKLTFLWRFILSNNFTLHSYFKPDNMRIY